MRSVEVPDPPAAPAGRADAHHPAPALPRRVPAAGWLVALYLAACALYAVLALRSPLPSLFPDEYRYAHLARGLADGTGFDWHGVHIDQTAALYVYFIAPAWALFDSTVDAYNISKVLGTLALCAQVVPVWLLGRELVGPRAALVPAVLSVAGTWMVAASTTATEVLAYPLATTALCLTVMALRRPGGRIAFVALAFALLATWARIQLAVLVPVILGVFALDALRAGPGGRIARLRAHRAVLGATGVVAVAGGLLVAVRPSVVGDYVYVLHLGLSGDAVGKVGLQLLELVALGGFVPVLLAAAMAVSPRAWRDERSGPLLLVFWSAALATALQSGVYIASADVPTGIERYVTYALPLAFVLLVVAARTPELRTGARFALAAVLGLALLAVPGTPLMAIERAIWSTGHRVDQLAGLGVAPAVTLVALLALGATYALLRRARSPRAAVAAVGIVVLGVLAVQSEAAWKQHLDLTRTFRTVLPADLQWVDHQGDGPVAFLGATASTAQLGVIDFFNRDLQRAYVPAGGLPGRLVLGGQCAWQIGKADGVVQFQPGCAPNGRRYFVDDPTTQVTLHDEARRADDPRAGHLVELARGARPRVLALLNAPCPRYPTPGFSTTSPRIVGVARNTPPCTGALSGQLWLDAPSKLVVKFQGGRAAHAVSAGSRTWDVPAGRVTSITFDVPAGPSQFGLSLDWTGAPGDPRFASAAIVARGRSTPISS